MILGALISISASSWFTIWIGLEINLLSFIPLIFKPKNLFSSESSLKYFLVQAIASRTLLFSILIFLIFLNLKITLSFYSQSLISLTLLLKRGVAPFHFWLPRVIEGLSWFSNALIITWQKIAPLIIISYYINLNLLIFCIILSIIFGRLGGLNQSSLRKLIAFSSINHLGWLLARLLYRENLWLLYFYFYSFLSLRIILIFYNFNLLNINQTFKITPYNFLSKISLFSILLSMGGLPPFLGFFPKWIVLEIIVNIKIMFILIIIVFFTLITLFFYLRIRYSALLIGHLIINWNFKETFKKNNIKILFFISFISLFGFIIINYFYAFL